MKREKGRSRSDWIQSALEQYEGPLIRYAYGIVRNPEKARDVVQDTFLALCRADRDKIENRLAPWLYTVCRNRALDIVRKKGRIVQIETEFLESFKANEPMPSEMLELKEKAQKVMEVMDMLPENQREVIHLKFQEGLSYKEISEVTGHSVSNVGFLIHVGIKTIREKLGKKLLMDLAI